MVWYLIISYRDDHNVGNYLTKPYAHTYTQTLVFNAYSTVHNQAHVFIISFIFMSIFKCIIIFTFKKCMLSYANLWFWISSVKRHTNEIKWNEMWIKKK